MAGRAMRRTTDAMLQTDLASAERVIIEGEDISAITRHAHDEAFALLALRAASEQRAIVSSIQLAADVQRMGEPAVHVAKIARRRHPHPVVPAEVRPLFADMGRFAVELSGGARAVLLWRGSPGAAPSSRGHAAQNEL